VRHIPDKRAIGHTTSIRLDFWLPRVILALGYIYVTVDLPVIRSLEASFPPLTLTLFS